MNSTIAMDGMATDAAIRPGRTRVHFPNMMPARTGVHTKHAAIMHQGPKQGTTPNTNGVEANAHAAKTLRNGSDRSAPLMISQHSAAAATTPIHTNPVGTIVCMNRLMAKSSRARGLGIPPPPAPNTTNCINHMNTLENEAATNMGTHSSKSHLMACGLRGFRSANPTFEGDPKHIRNVRHAARTRPIDARRIQGSSPTSTSASDAPGAKRHTMLPAIEQGWPQVTQTNSGGINSPWASVP
jgi:hypothetical protein